MGPGKSVTSHNGCRLQPVDCFGHLGPHPCPLPPGTTGLVREHDVTLDVVGFCLRCPRRRRTTADATWGRRRRRESVHRDADGRVLTQLPMVGRVADADEPLSYARGGRYSADAGGRCVALPAPAALARRSTNALTSGMISSRPIDLGIPVQGGKSFSASHFRPTTGLSGRRL